MLLIGDTHGGDGRRVGDLVELADVGDDVLGAAAVNDPDVALHCKRRARRKPKAVGRARRRLAPTRGTMSGRPRVPTCACASVRVGMRARAQAAASASMSSRV